MKQIPVVILLIAVFIFTAANTLEATGDDNTAQIIQLISEGDEFAEKIFDNKKALEKYKTALSLAPDNYEILWRLSRTYVDIGEHLTSNTDEEKQKQMEYYEKSQEFAKKAVAANPSGAMGYTRNAIANGRIALFRGVWESLDLVKQTKADCEKAISLDPNEATAYYVLGRTNAKVCEKPRIVRWPLGLGWANMEDAVKNYEKAIELKPDFIMYRLDCARAYIEMEEYDKARTHLTKIASLPKKDEDDDNFKKDAADLLEKIKEE